ncbi:MAG TPA: DHA2 family efflux MFS transporter permease subunit [Bacillales bacterium]|nr:DHA2 family efflux MFS transporter permease subunit [Bacillales bacterium]
MSKKTEVENPRDIKKGPMLTALLLGAFAAILNQTLLNVAIPEIMNDFDVSASTAQWLTTAYLLVNGVLIPVTAFLMQTISTRKLFLTAMICFAAGTLLCALAPSFFILLLGRIVQACGAGILIPLMTNIFMTIFPPEKRGTAMGTLGIVLMFAPAIGPTLSGWIVQNYSWRILFYIVLPIAIIDVIIAFFLMKNVLKLTFPKIDVSGIILSTVGFGALLYGFSEAGIKSWTDPVTLWGIIIGGVGVILFIWRELTAEEPMLEFRVFKYNMFALTTIVRSVAMMALFAGMLLIPIYMQNIRGFTPLESGLLLLPGALIMGIFQPITGRLFDKIGARPLAVIGLAMVVWSTWEFHNLSATTSYGYIMFLYGFRMVGMAGVMMPVMTAGLNQLPQRLTAHGTAMANTMRGVATSVGTAFLVSIYTNQTQDHLGSMLAGKGIRLPENMELSGSSAKEALAKLSPEMQHQIKTALNHALIQGMDDAFMVATGLATLAFVLSFFIKKTSPPDEQPETAKEPKASMASEG